MSKENTVIRWGKGSNLNLNLMVKQNELSTNGTKKQTNLFDFLKKTQEHLGKYRAFFRELSIHVFLCFT